jgi:hypothetical protein
MEDGAWAKLTASARAGVMAALKPHASWTAAGSAAPRRFGTRGTLPHFPNHRPPESGVAAALCHRSPNSCRVCATFHHRITEGGIKLNAGAPRTQRKFRLATCRILRAPAFFLSVSIGVHPWLKILVNNEN